MYCSIIWPIVLETVLTLQDSVKSFVSSIIVVILPQQMVQKHYSIYYKLLYFFFMWVKKLILNTVKCNKYDYYLVIALANLLNQFEFKIVLTNCVSQTFPANPLCGKQHLYLQRTGKKSISGEKTKYL